MRQMRGGKRLRYEEGLRPARRQRRVDSPHHAVYGKQLPAGGPPNPSGTYPGPSAKSRSWDRPSY